MAIEGLQYNGDISNAPQGRDWYASTQGEVLQYTTPSRNTPLQYKDAVALCTSKDARIWDQKPQQGLGFHHIKYKQDY